MVFPHEHVLIRFNGHFGTSSSVVDRWSSGIRFGLPGSAPAFDPAKLQTFVNACQTAANTFHSGTQSWTGTNAFLDYVSGAQIGVLGKYSPATQLTVVSPVNTTAGNGSPVLPWNSAMVISLRTAIPRGRGSNGRVYWPAIAAAVSATTGRLGSAPTQARLNLFKAFLDSCNDAANTYSAGMKAIVASNVGGGLYATVTSVRSDDRIDSIERRENDQPATYVTAAIP